MDRRYKEDFIQAGAIAREIRAYGKSLIKRGASYNAIIRDVLHKIHAMGARPAFPPQIALDNVAAHFLPPPDQDIILHNQVVKLDVGVCYRGAIGDCAVTVDLSGKHSKLVEAAEAALAAAETHIVVGESMRTIGKIIADTIMAHGFKPIRNLAGHGLGKYLIHTAPSVPNFDDGQSNARIRPGMTFAIEPFATTGAGWIEERGEATIFSQIGRHGVRDELRGLMERIGAFNKLPFAIHDLVDDQHGLEFVRQALAELGDRGNIAGYKPLYEVAQGIVAQAENSVLVDENGHIFITTR
jgi:methionyl aminopeptidase